MTAESHEAEAAVLGAIMVRPEAFAEVEGELGVDDFDSPRHRAIWSAMVKVAKTAEPIDVVQLEYACRANDTLGLAGGTDYFNRLGREHPSSRNVMHHVSIVRGEARRRRIYTALSELREEAAAAGHTECDEIVEAALARITKLARGDTGRLVGPREIMEVAYEDARRRFEGDATAEPITTGLTQLDEVLEGGLEPGCLYIVGARPGNGKTAFGMNVILTAARLGINAIGIHLEMTKKQLGRRLFAWRGGIDLKYTRKPTITRHLDYMLRSMDDMDGLPIKSTFDPMTSREVWAEMRSWRRDNPGRAVGVVDYLQLHEDETPRGATRESVVAAISKGYKARAKELAMPILLLAQLNRGVEQREDKRPRMSDLRESGAIEQDADGIFFLYREAAYTDGADIHDAEVIIGKNREGPLKTVPVRFEPYYTRFLDKPEQPPEQRDGEETIPPPRVGGGSKRRYQTPRGARAHADRNDD